MLLIRYPTSPFTFGCQCCHVLDDRSISLRLDQTCYLLRDNSHGSDMINGRQGTNVAYGVLMQRTKVLRLSRRNHQVCSYCRIISINLHRELHSVHTILGFHSLSTAPSIMHPQKLCRCTREAAVRVSVGNGRPLSLVDCTTPCQNGGSCIGPNVCRCNDYTVWTGRFCAKQGELWPVYFCLWRWLGTESTKDLTFSMVSHPYTHLTTIACCVTYVSLPPLCAGESSAAYYYGATQTSTVFQGNGSTTEFNESSAMTQLSRRQITNLVDFIPPAGKYLFRPAFTIVGRTNVVFQVRGPADANILLSDETTAEPWQIIIGGWNNGRSVIRKSIYNEVAAADTPNMLSTSEFRSFWISWAGSTIEFGKVCVVLGKS